MGKIVNYLGVFLVMLIVASSTVMAGGGSPAIDKECRDAYGKDAFGIAGFEATDFKMVHYMANYSMMGYNIELVGDEYNATWTADIPVYGVIVTTTGDDQLFSGGIEGSVNSGSDKHKMNDITFCGYGDDSNGGGDDPSGVPEFSFVTLGAAVALAGLGLAYFRKN